MRFSYRPLTTVFEHTPSELGSSGAGNPVHADEHGHARLIRRVKHQNVAVAGRWGFVDAGGSARLGEGGDSMEWAVNSLGGPGLRAESHPHATDRQRPPVVAPRRAKGKRGSVPRAPHATGATAEADPFRRVERRLPP